MQGIIREGFLVGGVDVPAVNGSAYGRGVYTCCIPKDGTALRFSPAAAMMYAQGEPRAAFAASPVTRTLCDRTYDLPPVSMTSAASDRLIIAKAMMGGAEDHKRVSKVSVHERCPRAFGRTPFAGTRRCLTVLFPPAQDWVILTSGHQLVPLYVVHFTYKG